MEQAPSGVKPVTAPVNTGAAPRRRVREQADEQWRLLQGVVSQFELSGVRRWSATPTFSPVTPLTPGTGAFGTILRTVTA